MKEYCCKDCEHKIGLLHSTCYNFKIAQAKLEGINEGRKQAFKECLDESLRLSYGDIKPFIEKELTEGKDE